MRTVAEHLAACLEIARPAAPLDVVLLDAVGCVLAEDVVADLRLRHRPPHRRAGLCHRIAPQIYGKQRTHLQTTLPKFALLTLFHFQII